MPTRHHIADYGDIKPTHEFDARLVIDGRLSPLYGVKLWLPIDCHEDARIQVTGSDSASSPHPRSVDGGIGSPRLVSEIDPVFGFEVSVITQSDGLLITIGDGQDGQDIRGQQNGTGIATGAVLPFVG